MLGVPEVVPEDFPPLFQLQPLYHRFDKAMWDEPVGAGVQKEQRVPSRFV